MKEKQEENKATKEEQSMEQGCSSKISDEHSLHFSSTKAEEVGSLESGARPNGDVIPMNFGHVTIPACTADSLDSVQTRCIVKGEAQKSPLFWQFSPSGGLWFSEERLFCKNSTRKPLNFIKSPICTNAPCTSACLCNAPSVHTVDSLTACYADAVSRVNRLTLASGLHFPAFERLCPTRSLASFWRNAWKHSLRLYTTTITQVTPTLFKKELRQWRRDAASKDTLRKSPQ